MKIKFEVSDFVAAVNWVTKGLDMKEESSFTSLHIDEDENVTLVSTSSRFYKKVQVDTESVDLDGENEFQVSFDSRYIQKLSGALGGAAQGSLVFSKDTKKKTSPLRVKSSHGSFTVPEVRSKAVVDQELVVIAEVSEQEFFETLNSLAPIANAATDSADAMGTVALKIAEDDDGQGKITFMATDTFALGEMSIDCDIEDHGLKDDDLNLEAILIPKSSALMVPTPKDSPNSIQIVYNKKSKRFGYVFTDNRVALFSLDLSDPILYQKMKSNIVKMADASVTVSLPELKKAINVVSSLAWEEVDVRLVLDKEKSVLRVKDNTDSNSVEVAVDSIDYDRDEEIDVKFMRNVIKAAFNPIVSSEMKFYFASNGNTKACVFRPVVENGEVSDSVLSFAVVRS